MAYVSILKRTTLKKFAVGALLSAMSICSVFNSATAEETKRRYAMDVIVSGVPFWRETKQTWEQIDKAHPEVSLIFGGPKDTSVETQIASLEALINQGIDGLVIAPGDSASLNSVVNKAIDAGIPVVTYLVDLPTSKRLAYVSSELTQASESVAKQVFGATPKAGEAIILYAQAGNEEQELRRQGFVNAIAKQADVTLVDTLEDYYDENRGAAALKALLLKHKNVRYVFGANSRSAVAAVTALKELGKKPGEVIVTGWDRDADVLQLVKSGWVATTVSQRSRHMTRMVFDILEAYNHNYLYNGDSKKHANNHDLPEKILVPVSLITQENVSSFMPPPKE